MARVNGALKKEGRGEAAAAFSIDSQDFQDTGSALPTFSKIPATFSARVDIAAIRTTLKIAQIKPYSIAVAPASLRKNRAIKFFIATSAEPLIEAPRRSLAAAVQSKLRD
jgi:hypothetical protein